jgi:hypothetical protein
MVSTKEQIKEGKSNTTTFCFCAKHESMVGKGFLSRGPLKIKEENCDFCSMSGKKRLSVCWV